MYRALIKQHMPERRFLEMGNAMRKLMHSLCQRSLMMRKLRVEHPSWIQNIGKLLGWMTGWKVCSDAKGMMTLLSMMPLVQRPPGNYAQQKNQQRRLPWLVHHCKVVMNKKLLGRLPGENNKQGKISLQQQHAPALQGMQHIFRKGHFLLQWLCQKSAGELPPTLPHIPSQQGICINDGYKQTIYININTKYCKTRRKVS